MFKKRKITVMHKMQQKHRLPGKLNHFCETKTIKINKHKSIMFEAKIKKRKTLQS